jgi:hypothetical protein
MSDKRQSESRVYSKLRREFLALHPFCEAFDNCSARSRDVHHKAGRGKNYLVVETWKAACRKHHKWIHGNPNQARDAGLLV